MNFGIWRVILCVLILVSATGCSVMGDAIDEILTTPSTKRRLANESFEDTKSEIESRARQGMISWAQAVRELRETDRDLAQENNRGVWKYDSDDEEYYAYCLQLAERLDSRQITYAQFDAARIQRLNQINARRQQLDEQQRQTEIQRESQRQQQQEALNRNRSLNCTSNVIGGQIYTSCY